MKSDKCTTKSVWLLLRCSCEGDIQCSQMSHDYRSHPIFAMLSVRTINARAELIMRIATASLSECQQWGIGWPGGGGCFAVCVERRHVPADLRVTMDCMWIKYSSTLTYLSGRRFLQGGPLEITLTCQPVATLPASFSIKQANNTIPTPINKSAFLNKVQYTGSL